MTTEEKRGFYQEQLERLASVKEQAPYLRQQARAQAQLERLRERLAARTAQTPA